MSTINALRLAAHATDLYGGMNLPTFERDDAGRLMAATVTVYRRVGNEWRGWTAKAMYAEHAPGADASQRDQHTEQWLAEQAEAMALAMAFPSSNVPFIVRGDGSGPWGILHPLNEAGRRFLIEQIGGGE